mgnify:CR=1 FL=1
MLDMESPRYTKITIEGHVVGLLPIKVFLGFIIEAYIFTRDNDFVCMHLQKPNRELFALAHNMLPHYQD